MHIISVIVPVYNGEKTILETLESVLKQSFADFELIVINDGSQDSTLEVVESIQDPRLKLFSYPNAGLAASRNRGLSHASGEFIAFLDADDLWTPDKLETQMKALQVNPQASVAYSWTDYIDESGQFLVLGSHISVSGYVYPKLLVINFIENGSNTLIRKQALVEVGGFDESLAATEDWDMWLRLAARYHFVAVPLQQILYRVSANAMSADLLKMEATCLHVMNRAFTQAPESLQHLKQYSLAHIYKFLTCKALQDPPKRDKGLAAAGFLWKYVKNNPSRFHRFPFILILAIKIIAFLFLPTQQVQTLQKSVKSLIVRIRSQIL